MPFGDYVVPRLDFLFNLIPRPADDNRVRSTFVVDSDRLKQQVIYFGVTGQILQAIEEYFVPLFKRKFFSEAKRITHIADESVSVFDTAEEKAFLQKVRGEIELDEYEIYEDYDEMVVQVQSML